MRSPRNRKMSVDFSRTQSVIKIFMNRSWIMTGRTILLEQFRDFFYVAFLRFHSAAYSSTALKLSNDYSKIMPYTFVIPRIFLTPRMSHFLVKYPILSSGQIIYIYIFLIKVAVNFASPFVDSITLVEFLNFQYR